MFVRLNCHNCDSGLRRCYDSYPSLAAQTKAWNVSFLLCYHNFFSPTAFKRVIEVRGGGCTATASYPTYCQFALTKGETLKYRILMVAVFTCLHGCLPKKTADQRVYCSCASQTVPLGTV